MGARFKALALAATRLCLLCVASLVSADDQRSESAQAAPAPAAAFSCSPTIHGLAHARRRGDGAVIATQRISGHGTIQAEHVVINDTLSPGDSPGCIDFGGSVTFSATATLVMELGGTTPCTDYDRITVANTLTIDNATLEVVLINGFEPGYGDSFDILDWGALTGSFSDINTTAAPLSYPLQWDTSELHLNGQLRVGVIPISDGDLAPWNAPDGEINAADILIAIQLATLRRTAGPLQLAHGDMNSDGVIDIVDLLAIQHIASP